MESSDKRGVKNFNKTVKCVYEVVASRNYRKIRKTFQSRRWRRKYRSETPQSITSINVPTVNLKMK